MAKQDPILICVHIGNFSYSRFAVNSIIVLAIPDLIIYKKYIAADLWNEINEKIDKKIFVLVIPLNKCARCETGRVIQG